ncbi:MAG: glycosyltransferase family 2 protein [Archaeoglobaceae archaeon]
MKALLVILNKDNAKKLEECLKSVISQSAKLCRDFDVLILDGASRDNSKEVAEEFSRNYPCIKFKVQEKLGGTGFARKEACEFAVKNGYDVIIWGDSENVYSFDYIEKIMQEIRGFDAVGGVPIVKGNFYSHAFAWYHAIHIVFNIQKIHIPGNNRADKTEIYRFLSYPESKRAEDYGFSLLLLKNGIRLRQKIVDARVFVSLPEKLKDIVAWQRARVKGCAEALRLVNFAPFDLIVWSSLVLLFFLFLALCQINFLPFLVYSMLIFSFSVFLFIRSYRFIEKPRPWLFFAPLFGVFVHSVFSLLGLFYYFKLGKNRK